MIVVDASALVEVLLETSDAQSIADRLLGEAESLHAPHLLDLEVAQVMRRYVRHRELTPSRGRQALDDLADFPITRYPHDVLLSRIWELRSNFTAYDAAYISLAEVLKAPLLTRDAAFAKTRGHRAEIEWI